MKFLYTFIIYVLYKKFSEKEYVVKTNEGYRIKDILEGYIDIIKRSLAGPRKVNFIAGEAIFEDNVEMSRYKYLY